MNEELLSGIWQVVRTTGTLESIDDLYRLCATMRGEEACAADRALGLKYLRRLNGYLMENIGRYRGRDIIEAYDLHKRILRCAARDDFDCFLLYLEWNRDADKKFYPPRRPQLRPIVEGLQRLADDELDLVCISMPPGTGKSTTAILYLCWLAGRHPDKPILGGSHSNSFIRGVYDECLRVITGNGDEYLWADVFSDVPLANTNAKDCRIDMGIRKRFETLQFTSVGSGNAGLYRAEQLLYCDDLVDGIETAMSRDRLNKLWEQYTTDLRQRKIGACKELHIATRWSVHDVIGRLEEQYEKSDRALFLSFSALDENDESCFDYPCDAGFTSEFYRQQREIMDPISWGALYQNQPVEREGQLYVADELRRFFELPDGDPDGIFAVCDTKDRGSDFCVMPVVYKYGNDCYLADVICDDGRPDIVDERLARCLVDNHVHMACFESNSAGGKTAEKVQTRVRELGGKTKITTRYTTANKETKIQVESPWVLQNVLFKDDSVLTGQREYKRFLTQLCGYTMKGKNKHDDTPDAMAQLSIYIQSFSTAKVQVFQRPW